MGGVLKRYDAGTDSWLPVTGTKNSVTQEQLDNATTRPAIDQLYGGNLTTTSGSYVSVGATPVTLDVPVAGRYLVMVSAALSNSIDGNSAFILAARTGGAPPNDRRALQANSAQVRATRTYVDDLSVGQHTYELMMKTAGGTANANEAWLTIVPIVAAF